MNGLVEKASVLIEALPYIRTFFGKTFVIKYGGNAMIDSELKKAVTLDVILLRYVGVKPVLVHGGGPEINDMARQLGKTSRFIDGLRVTDAEMMEIAQMVLVGKINPGDRQSDQSLRREGGRIVRQRQQPDHRPQIHPRCLKRRSRICGRSRKGQSGDDPPVV